MFSTEPVGGTGFDGDQPSGARAPRDADRLRDYVAATVRQSIVAGKVRPGELLRLAPLAKQLDVSNTPVREAMLLLARDGWLVQELHRGFRVVAIRRDDVVDTYYVHKLIAGELAGRAAARVTPEAIAQLRELDAAIAALTEDDTRAEQWNYDLHRSIYASAEAPRLEWFVQAASRFVPRQFWGSVPGWREMNRIGHTPVLDALEQGDAHAARAAMSAHIGDAEQLLLSWLDSISFWD